MTDTVNRADVEALVRQRFDADIRIHRKFANNPRVSQEGRSRREHWAECLEDTRDETLAALSKLPSAPPSHTEGEMLLEALEEAYEAIGAAQAVLPVQRDPANDLQRLVNLAAGMLDIDRTELPQNMNNPYPLSKDHGNE